MLGENIRNLRTARGMTQSDLADRLHVVRQTVSKWEKGLSVPDAEMLEKMAELFDVSVSELLGSRIPETETTTDSVAEQLAILNTQLANQLAFRKRVFRTVLTIVASVLATIVVIYILAFSLFAYDGDVVESEHTEIIEITE